MAWKVSVLIVMVSLIAQYRTFPIKKKSTNRMKIFIWDRKLTEFQSWDRKINITDAHKTNYSAPSLENSIVKVMIDEMDPYIKSNATTRELSGYLGELWYILEDMLHFRTEFFQIEYTEGLEAMERNESDVFLASVVYKNLKNVQFSHPYFNVWYHLYFRLPEGKPPTYLHFTVFSTDLWLKIFCFFIFLTLILWLTCNAIKTTSEDSENVSSLPSCFLGVISAFANTGFDLKLQSHSARIQIFFALFFGSLCYYALSGSLVARLAVIDRTPPFVNLYEVSQKTTHVLCLRNNSFVYNNFTDEEKAMLPRWKGILNTADCPNMLKWKNIPKVICKSNFLVLENRILMSLVLNERLFCTVSFLPQKYFPSGNFFLMNKKFKGIKSISKSITLIRSSGVMQKVEDNWVKKHEISSSSVRNVKEITFSHVRGLISIYFYLIFGTIGILLLEILHYRIMVKANTKNIKPAVPSTKIFEYKGNVWYIK